MKLKIKVKLLNINCTPVINNMGDWIDLKSSVNINLPAPQYHTMQKFEIGDTIEKRRNVTLKTYHIPLGVAIQLPKGFESVVNSRSSGPNKLGLFIPNGQGVIDNSYNGNGDEWNYVCSPMRDTYISEGDRICQFRIQLSQKATMWQKLRWLLSSGIKIVYVNDLGNNNRGGLGSSGIK